MRVRAEAAVSPLRSALTLAAWFASGVLMGSGFGLFFIGIVCFWLGLGLAVFLPTYGHRLRSVVAFALGLVAVIAGLLAA